MIDHELNIIQVTLCMVIIKNNSEEKNSLAGDYFDLAKTALHF